jgi:hypothetical protein
MMWAKQAYGVDKTRSYDDVKVFWILPIGRSILGTLNAVQNSLKIFVPVIVYISLFEQCPFHFSSVSSSKKSAAYCMAPAKLSGGLSPFPHHARHSSSSRLFVASFSLS